MKDRTTIVGFLANRTGSRPIQKTFAFAGALLAFAGGIYGGHKLIDYGHSSVSKETRVLDNIKEDDLGVSRHGLPEPAAYLLTDDYLFRAKNIKVNTFVISKNYNVLEIEVMKGDTLVQLDSKSAEYKEIINLRDKLATSIIEISLFNEGVDQEIIDFANFTSENYNSSPGDWILMSYINMALVTAAATCAAALAGVGGNRVGEALEDTIDDMYWEYCRRKRAKAEKAEQEKKKNKYDNSLEL